MHRSLDPPRSIVLLRVSQICRLSIQFAMIVSVQAPLVTPAIAHGYMTYPVSRALEHLPGDPKGWPIAGVKARFRREPCLGIDQNKEFAPVNQGTFTLQFFFPDGANHIGNCAAYLLNPLLPDSRIKIGEQMDCARSTFPGAGKKGQDILGEMHVVIPRKLPCDPSHCVLLWSWTATHMSATDPERFEHYDNCADIRVIGAQKISVITQATPEVTTELSERLANITAAQGYIQQMLADAMLEDDRTSEQKIHLSLSAATALQVTDWPNPTAVTQSKNLNKQGVQLVAQAKLADARDVFLSAYRLNPQDAEIANNLGYSYMLLDNLTAAEPTLLQAIVLQPDRANAWANLGQTFAKLGYRQKSVAAFSLAYRFSAKPEQTYQFLEKLTRDDNPLISESAMRTLLLDLLHRDR